MLMETYKFLKVKGPQNPVLADVAQFFIDRLSESLTKADASTTDPNMRIDFPFLTQAYRVVSEVRDWNEGDPNALTGVVKAHLFGDYLVKALAQMLP
mmetsp:Transcript_47492/g.34767  ORF Transcript_47492/g.34767 Transcript_47492/m.34767 type:complete len:97 (-) Transcript_47492:508-798(-)